jgi:hypothetical protein
MMKSNDHAYCHPEGHLARGQQIGWYREGNTRSEKTLENPPLAEEGATHWNTVEGTVGKSCASRYDDGATHHERRGRAFAVFIIEVAEAAQ